MVEKTSLPCGLTILSENFPQFPSLTLSYTLKAGSRVETVDNAGLHHLLEHMLFKGCGKYDLKKIADISDRMGGSLNAFTAKEITQYYMKSVDSRFPQAFDLLSQMVMDSSFPDEEFAKEKNVVLQEIKEAEDSPDTHALEVFFEGVYPRSGLGLPIEGKKESVSAIDRESIYSAYQRLYRPENLILCAVGKIRHEDLVTEAERFFSQHPAAIPLPVSFPSAAFRAVNFSKSNRSLKQNYVFIGFRGISRVSPMRHRFMIMNNILGAGMSSRLFQRIREEKGLAYSISSFGESYLDDGILMVDAAVDPAKTGEYIEAVREEICRLHDEGVSAEELKRAKESMISAYVLNLESNASKMRFNVSNEIALGRECSVEEIMADISATTSQDIAALADQTLDVSHAALFVYGRVKPGMSLSF